MNRNYFMMGALALAILSGCARQRYTTPPVYPGEPRALLPEVTTPPPEAGLLSLAATQPLAPFGPGDWRDLFDGRNFTGWRQTEFDEGGRVYLTNGLMVLERGTPFVGVNATNPIPQINYEVAFDAMRVAGEDFFCGLTFPIHDMHCSWIVGGWGGGIVGLSNVDGNNASENETTKYISFETGRWYRLRLRVTEQKIEAWVEQKKVVDLPIAGRGFEVRFGEIMLSKPFGLCSWDTSAAYRAIKIRDVSVADAPMRGP